ncbi:MAG: APC family permease [Methanomassiliicoccus sp.]|nr:APC family permease [Methanomassiliicoccus sp.]
MKPSLNLTDATAINIGAIIGSGIFVVTGISAGYAGSAIVVSIVIAGVVSVLTAMSIVELTLWDPKEGGVYDYACRLISPLAGFISGWIWAFSNTLIGAAVALSFAYYLDAIVPGVSVNIVAALICLVFTVLNYLGASHSSEINNIIVVAKLALLSFFVVFGLLFINPSNFLPFEPLQMGVLVGAFYIFFSFGGFARVTVIAEEIKNPRKNIPRAIFLSIAISIVFYILVALVAIGVVGAPALSGSSSPLAYAMGRTGNQLAVLLISIGGILATASVLITTILGVSRMEYAMARRGDLPRRLSYLQKRHGTPYWSIWITGTIIIILVLFVDVVSVVALSTFTQIVYYMVANLSAFRLKGVNRRYPKSVPVLGLSSCVVLLLASVFIAPQAIVLGTLGIVSGLIIWAISTEITKRSKYDQ